MAKQQEIIDLKASLKAEIIQSACDIRAEAQVLMAMERGLSLDDFLATFDCLFNREYSKDLITAEIKEDPRKQPLLMLHLSRAGIYDQLPEGLFFQLPQRSSKNMTAASLAALYKENKKKEEGIRRFFQPFENEFFIHGLKIEEEETALLKGLQSFILNDYFARFWNLPPSIPAKMVIPLILLLPYAYQIAGDLQLTAQSLAELLSEEVSVTRKNTMLCSAEGITPPSLGEAALGIDMLCGNMFMEDTPVMAIEIGPLRNSRPADYLEGGNRFVLMETFNRFFIPAGVDTTLAINITTADQHMTLGSRTAPVLGYSTVLG